MAGGACCDSPRRGWGPSFLHGGGVEAGGCCDWLRRAVTRRGQPVQGSRRRRERHAVMPSHRHAILGVPRGPTRSKHALPSCQIVRCHFPGAPNADADGCPPPPRPAWLRLTCSSRSAAPFFTADVMRGGGVITAPQHNVGAPAILSRRRIPPPSFLDSVGGGVPHVAACGSIMWQRAATPPTHTHTEIYPSWSRETPPTLTTVGGANSANLLARLCCFVPHCTPAGQIRLL